MASEWLDANGFDQEPMWEILLDDIARGHVIPVIGPELISVSFEGKDVPLYEWLVPQLASALRIPLDGNGPPANLSDVVHRYLQGGQNQKYCYLQVGKILREARLKAPETLRILARIRPLRLFVTTTIDDLLESALREVRSDISSCSFSPKQGPSEKPPSGAGAIVFHLFGKANLSTRFVLSEDDLLEFSHHWLKEEEQHTWVKAMLSRPETQFMILGCGFENWMARFFLYGLRSNLPDRKEENGLVADQIAATDPSLSAFLRRYKFRPEKDAPGFVRELGRRWEERIKEEGGMAAATEDPDSDRSNSSETSFVFLSYASEDKEIARQVREALSQKGVEVWFDDRRLEAADHYERKILQAIRASSLFVPLITMHNLNVEGERFFLAEWDAATRSTKFRHSDDPFLLPLVLDGIQPSHPRIKDEFKQIHWSRFGLSDQGPGRIARETDLTRFAETCREKIRVLNRLSR